MSLEKETDYFGVKANYWKIIDSKNDYIRGITHCSLGLYLNTLARSESIGNVLKRYNVQLIGVDLTREQIYALMKVSKLQDGKETNFFVDAIDC